MLGKFYDLAVRMKIKPFLFLKKEINLKVEIFFRTFSEKTEYFNTEFVSYSVNIQPDIMQNW